MLKTTGVKGAQFVHKNVKMLKTTGVKGAETFAIASPIASLPELATGTASVALWIEYGNGEMEA